MLKKFPQDTICLDYQPEMSLFSIVSSAGGLQLTTNGSSKSLNISEHIYELVLNFILADTSN